MRPRDQIMDQNYHQVADLGTMLIVEALVDIRDLLSCIDDHLEQMVTPIKEENSSNGKRL